MRPAALVALALLALGAATAAQSTSPAPPLRAFPLPVEALVVEQYAATDSPLQIFPLPGGKLLLGTSERALVLDTDLHVERSVVGPASSPILGVYEGGRLVLTAQQRFDFTTDASSSHPLHAVYAACDRETRRCVRTNGGGASFAAFVEDASIGYQLASVQVLPSDAGYTTDEVRRRNVRFAHGTDVMIDGDLLALRFTAGRSALCVFDTWRRTKLGCTGLDDATRLVHLSSASNRACVASQTRFECIDVRAITAPRPPARALAFRAIAPDASAILVAEGETLRVLDTTQFARLGDDLAPATRVVLGAGRHATVVGERVRFWIAGGYAPDATLARALESPERAAMTFVGDDLVLASPSQGVARIGPGASGVRFIGPREGAAVQFAASETDLLVRAEGTRLHLSRRGMTTTGDPARAAAFTESRARFAMADAAHDSERGDVIVAVRPPELTNPVFARLASRRLRVLDREEHDTVAPLVLPSWVTSTGCDAFLFITSNELVLLGQHAECTPMRVRIAPRRVLRLRGIVSASQTSNGARTALLVAPRVSLIDGATGDVLREMQTTVSDAHRVVLGEDAERVVVLGHDGYEIFRPGEPPRTYTFAREGRYDMANDVLYRCEGENLVFRSPSTRTEFRRITSPACESQRRHGSWHAIPGFLAHGIGHRLWIIRVADGATLDLTFIHEHDHFVRVLREGRNVLGVAPDETRTVAFRDPGTGTRSRTAPSARTVDARIDAFFRGP